MSSLGIECGICARVTSEVLAHLFNLNTPLPLFYTPFPFEQNYNGIIFDMSRDWLRPLNLTISQSTRMYSKYEGYYKNYENACEMYLAIAVAEDTANLAVKSLNARIKSGNFSRAFSRFYSSTNKIPYVPITVTGNFSFEPWIVKEEKCEW